MKFRKSIAVMAAMLVGLTVFTGCNNKQNNEVDADTSAAQSSSQLPAVQAKEALPMVKLGVLQGPTGLGLVELMEKTENQEAQNIYQFTVAGAPDEISGKIISGELDIACVPTNLASVLYNKTEGKVRVVAVNTLGVLYLLQRPEEGEDAVASFEELEGETIYTTGQGATQEYVLNYLLKANGVADAQVEFKSEHAELASLMLEGSVEYALLPQPFVTTVTTRDEDVEIALDITEEWETATGGKQLTMGCVVVREEFLEKNEAAVNAFLEELAQSVAFVNGNVVEAAELSAKFEIVQQEIAEKAIPQCNIVCLTGEDMKTSLSEYLSILEKADPQSVGGSLPDDAFYYIQG